MPLCKLKVPFFVFLLIAHITSTKAYSQENAFAKRLVFSFEPQFGFVMPHHDYMAYFLQENISGFQLNVGLLTLGSKDWHRYYNYPQIGAGFYHSSLGNNKIYGKMNALYLYVDRKFLPLHYRLNIGNRIAFGLSYMNKYYDKESNPTNIIIATPINAFIQYDLMAYFRVNQSITVKMNLGFTHTSNGSIKDPNKGFNVINTGFGLQYALSDERNVSKNIPSSEEHKKTHQFYMGVISGCKSITRLDDKTYALMGVSGEYLYQVNPTTSIGGEVAAYWDSSNKDESEPEDGESFSDIDYINITINPTYALKMGRIYFAFQPGVYIKNKVNHYGIVTNKVGLRYQVSPKLMASMAIKAHWLAKADFIEFGVRYNIL